MPYRETNFTNVANQDTKGSLYLESLYDGMLVYAQALQKTLQETGFDPNKTVRGSQMYYKMMGESFKGMFQIIQNKSRMEPEISSEE